MFKIYSKACEYALRILTQIPKERIGEKILAVELCRKAKVPIASSRKVLQLLVEQKYLEAVSGPGGGYRLLKSPNEMTLLSIIRAIDGEDAFDHCIMGLPQCSSEKPCPIHHLWQKIKIDMKKEMNEKTLSQLMDTIKERKL